MATKTANITYLVNVNGFDDLKAQYRALAKELHPDTPNGSTEAMQQLNNEYDHLFTHWKALDDIATEDTAQSTRAAYYEENGWEGENYSGSLWTTDITRLVREYIRVKHNSWRFRCYQRHHSSIYVKLTEAPCEVYKKPEDWTDEDKSKWAHDEYIYRDNYRYTEEQLAKEKAKHFYTDQAAATFEDIESYVKSYNYDHSQWSGGDYLQNYNFYFYNVEVDEYKIVPRKHKTNVTEYETYTVDVEEVEHYPDTREIPRPKKLEVGQRFKLKAGFNYGCRRGNVYEITSINDTTFSAYKLDRKLAKTCTGDVRGNRFGGSLEKLEQWLDQDAIAFVEVFTNSRTVTKKRTRRRPKSPGQAVSTETREATATERAAYAEAAATQATGGKTGAGKAYTITPDTHTKTDKALWVLKFTDWLPHDEYLAIRAELDTIQGKYSKYKKGFVFYYDPAQAVAELYGTAATEGQAAGEEPAAEAKPKEEPTTEAELALADWIEDASTEIIGSLYLRPMQYLTNADYRRRLRKAIEPKREQITPRVLAALPVQDLADLVAQILLTFGEPVNPDGTYNMEVIGAYSREEYCQWYMAEFARLYPNAQIGVDYSINDAEFYYTEFHRDKKQATA